MQLYIREISQICAVIPKLAKMRDRSNCIPKFCLKIENLGNCILL